MPICCRPGAKVPYVLKGDEKLPEPRPRFFLKAITAEQAMGIADQLGEMRTSKFESTRAPLEKLCQILEPWVLGWDNIEGKTFGTDKLTSFLNVGEVRELIQSLIGGISEADKGN